MKLLCVIRVAHSKQINVGQYQLVIETPFKWRFVGGLIAARDCMLAACNIIGTITNHRFIRQTVYLFELRLNTAICLRRSWDMSLWRSQKWFQHVHRLICGIVMVCKLAILFVMGNYNLLCIVMISRLTLCEFLALKIMKMQYLNEFDVYGLRISVVNVLI